MLRHLFHKKQPDPEWLRGLRRGDVAIDCGANVGCVTRKLARTGATVYAFEPNPHAFAKLKQNVESFKNVTCFPVAVGVGPGRAKLYMHAKADEDPIRYSSGSSMLECKCNVNPADYVEVECVDLCEFIRTLPRPVKLLKIDVEGLECEILNKLFDTGLISTIGRVLCELHDAKITQLRESCDRIRRYVRENDLRHVDLNWR